MKTLTAASSGFIGYYAQYILYLKCDIEKQIDYKPVKNMYINASECLY